MSYVTCTPTGRVLIFRGVEYQQRECLQGPYPANLWLTYRGKRYRPASIRSQLNWLG